MMKSFSKVSLDLTLLYPGGVHGIFLVAGQFVRDELVEDEVDDERALDGNSVGIIGSGVDYLGVGGLCKTHDEESQRMGFKAFS